MKRRLHLICGSFFLLLVLITESVTLTSCYDLGAFGDGEEEGYKDYYESFGSVEALYQDGSASYDIEDSLYNTTTINELKWDSSSDEVSEEEYAYIAIPVEVGMSIKSFSLFLKSNITTTLHIKVYVLTDGASIPSGFFRYDDDPDDDSYDDPTDEFLVNTVTVSCTEGKWISFSCSFGRKGTSNKSGYRVSDGDIILLRIDDNTGFGKAAGYPRCAFRFINLMVCASERDKT